MTISIRPEIQRFIDDQVKSGRFATPEDVVEAAIAEMRVIADLELDEATIAAINEGEAQADRGEGVDFDAFRQQWKKQHGGT